MDTITILDPHYQTSMLHEYSGNPLIEALEPIPLSELEVVKRLIQKPQFSEAELNLPAAIRKHFPLRLRNYMWPTAKQVQIFYGIMMQVFDGYLHRNPLTPHGQMLLHRDRREYKTMRFKKTHKPGTISFITGLSGMGKSITIEGVLNALGATVIFHKDYRGKTFTESQIVALKSNVHTKISPKMFARKYGETADNLLGVDLYKTFFNDQTLAAQDYIFELHKIISNHHVGVLAIDEFQNIRPEENNEDQQIIDLIVEMRELLGVPIILAGTYKAANVLVKNSSNARRFIEGGYYELQRPQSANEEEFRYFIDGMWQYQWLKDPKRLSDEIIETLYDCSMGITAIFINLFIFTQHYALDNEKEFIDAEMIRKVYKNRFTPLHNIIDCLRSCNRDFLLQFDDLYLDALQKLDFGGPSNLSAIDQMVHSINKQSDIKQVHKSVTR